jgi:hypothetical protein
VSPKASPADSLHVQFHFAPPAGSHWIQDFEDVRLSPDRTQPSGQREQRTTVRIDLRYERDPQGGWAVQKSPFEGEITFNGEGITNPALEQNLHTTLVVHLDDKGQALRVDGFKELERKYERNLPPEQYARLAKQYTAANMERMELTQWNQPLQDLIGAQVTTGETWHVTDTADIGSAELLVTGVISFDGWTELHGVRGYKVHYTYDTTGAAERSAPGPYARTISRVGPDSKATRSNIVLAGDVIRVIDPATGLVFYAHAHRAYDVPIQSQSQDASKAHYEDEQMVRLDPAPAAN